MDRGSVLRAAAALVCVVAIGCAALAQGGGGAAAPPGAGAAGSAGQPGGPPPGPPVGGGPLGGTGRGADGGARVGPPAPSVGPGTGVPGEVGGPDPATELTPGAAGGDAPDLGASGGELSPSIERPEETWQWTSPDQIVAQYGLELFGTKLIASARSVAELAASSSYLLGPGDSLEIVVLNTRTQRVLHEAGSSPQASDRAPAARDSGEAEASEGAETTAVSGSGPTSASRGSGLVINANGEIVLPLVNRLRVAGLTLSELEQLLADQYGKFYRDVTVQVRIVGRRTIPVWVLGEVANGGLKELDSLATVITAIAAAGGASEHGSLRQVRVIRGDQKIAEIDLYELFAQGRGIRSVPLEPGDTVFVPVATKVVAVYGEVRRPAFYELLDDNTLGAVLELAGGLRASAFAAQTEIRRWKDHDHLEIVNPAASDPATQLGDGDFVWVKAVREALRGAARVEGAVARPDVYAIAPGMRVSDLIRLAGGLLAEADPNSCWLARRNYAATGFTKVDLDLTRAVGEDEEANPTLREDDLLHVFTFEETGSLNVVRIAGPVARPGNFTFVDGMRLADLITLAGGVRSNALLARAEVRRRDSQYRVTVIPVEFSLGGEINPTLEPLDDVVLFSREELQDVVAVYVEGAVSEPRTLDWTEGLTISRALEAAHGLRHDAFGEYGYLYRSRAGTLPELVRFTIGKVLAHDLVEDLPLEPRDRVRILAIDEVGGLPVAIAGPVVRPGPYPYYANMTVRDLLVFAGDVTQEVYWPRGDIVRQTEAAAQQMLSFDVQKARQGAPEANLMLEPGDMVRLYSEAEAGTPQVVRVEGAVRLPGEKRYTSGMTVRDALFLAGNLAERAFGERGEIVRMTPDRREQILPFNVDDALASEGESDHNLALQPEDVVRISTREEREVERTVQVAGFVAREGIYPLTVGMTLEDLLNEAGGPNLEATDEVLIVRNLSSGRQEIRASIAGFRESGNRLVGENPQLMANDTVSVFAQPDFTRTDVASVLGQVQRQGGYPVYPGLDRPAMTISQLVKRAGGLRVLAYPEGAVLFRKSVPSVSAEQRAELDRFLAGIDEQHGFRARALDGSSPSLAAPNRQQSALQAATINRESSENLSAADLVSAGVTQADIASVAAEYAALGKSAEEAVALATQDLLKRVQEQRKFDAQTGNQAATQARGIAAPFGSTPLVVPVTTGRYEGGIAVVIPPRALRSREYSQAVPVNLAEVLEGEGTDLPLEPGDLLYVPRRPMTIAITGAVARAGLLAWREAAKLNDYILEAGGLATDADTKVLYVVHMNGMIELAPKQVLPGDVIVVPNKFQTQLVYQKKNVFERILGVLSETLLGVSQFLN